MRAVIQRVKEARVEVENGKIEQIGKGLVVLLGIARDDTEKESQYLAERIVNLRLFPEKEPASPASQRGEPAGGKEFEKSLITDRGEILVISQFTLYADCLKGRRPDFTQAAASEKAKSLYEHFIEKLKEKYEKLKTGEFGAKMVVEIHNDGPVTIILDTKR